ncbi:MAG: hypothetical protein HY650_01185, partial [Acidobacteria bacterium]|nr:hypothetical protein [Acidobacteriota bacterium]
KAVGTLYNSSEANSRKVVSVARDLFTGRGIRLEEVTVTGSSEILQAAQVLTHRSIQAMWVNEEIAKWLGVRFPAELIKEAAQ